MYRPSTNELAVSGLPFEFPMLHDNVSARQHRLDYATNPPAFIRTVIYTHVVGFRADGLLSVRIEDHDVRIRPNGDGALLGKSPKIFAAAVDVSSTKRFRL